MSEIKRQIAMVVDLNKCIGCQTCTVACKQLWTTGPGMEYMWWNIVNTMPGQSTPRNFSEMGGGWKDEEVASGKLPQKEDFGEAWDFNYDEVWNSGQGQQVHLKPQGPRPAWGPNWDEEQGAGEFPNSYFFNLPRLCNHCSKPACKAACPVKAIYKRQEDGAVLIDENKCRGTRMCNMACPYKRIYFNNDLGRSQKCIGCFPRLEKGVAPACVRQCPGRARHFGYMDNKKGQVYKLVNAWKVALPLYEEAGTRPNVFYIPPVLPAPIRADGESSKAGSRVPLEYLQKLFGKAVIRALRTLKEERQKKQARQKSELMDILISRRWEDMLGEFKEQPARRQPEPLSLLGQRARALPGLFSGQ